MTAFVLDTSVTLSWLLADERHSSPTMLLDRLVEEGALVPCLWSLEVGNALLVAERRNRIGARERVTALVHLAALPITIDSGTADRAWHETMALAVTHALTLYDAAYLELSLRFALPLATLDASLAAAADRAGVVVLGR